MSFVLGLFTGCVITAAIFCLASATINKLKEISYIRLENDRDKWKADAINATAKLGEIRIWEAKQKCDRCKDEDTYKCINCSK